MSIYVSFMKKTLKYANYFLHRKGSPQLEIKQDLNYIPLEVTKLQLQLSLTMPRVNTNGFFTLQSQSHFLLLQFEIYSEKNAINKLKKITACH